MTNDNTDFIKWNEENNVKEENERLKVLINNLTAEYSKVMSEEELHKFLTIEVGFTDSEYDSYVKKY